MYFLGQPVPIPNHSHSHQTIYQVTCWYYYSITITFTVVLTCRKVQGPLLGTFPLGFFFLHRKTVEFLYFLWGQTIALLSNPSAKKTTKADKASCTRQLLLHQIRCSRHKKQKTKKNHPKTNKAEQKTAQRCLPVQKAEDKSGLLKSHLKIKGRTWCGYYFRMAQDIILECATKCITACVYRALIDKWRGFFYYLLKCFKKQFIFLLTFCATYHSC